MSIFALVIKLLHITLLHKVDFYYECNLNGDQCVICFMNLFHSKLDAFLFALIVL